MQIKIPNNFVPRLYQKRPMRYLDNGGKRLVWIVHRRGGKDLTMLHQTCKMMHKRVGMYWHVFPSFAQGRKAIWEGFRKDGPRIMDNVFPGFSDPRGPMSVVAKKDEQSMSITLKCGSIWRLIGSDRIEVVGAGPVGVTFSEYALSRPKAWDMIRPMLRENAGWAAFITTPRGNNHAKTMYEEAGKTKGWFRDLQTVMDTGQMYVSSRDPDTLLTADQMMQEEREEGMPEALVQQEYMCDWNIANVGTVYGDLIAKLVELGGVENFNDESGDVFAVFDLGKSDSTAIWTWRYNPDGGIDILDFMDDHGKELSHYFGWLERLPYRVSRHYLPHDASQHTLATKMSVLDQFMARYPGKVDVVPKLPLVDGIQAARWLLQQGPRFHTRCAEGIEALKSYHYSFDEDRKTYSSLPEHDWASHPADSFRYLAVVVKLAKLHVKRDAKKKEIVKLEAPSYGSLDDLFAERERGMAR